MADTVTAVNDLLNAPEAPAEATPSAAAPVAPAVTPTTPAATPTEPWLKVNDRTVYNSKEDAIKGYTELQASYAKLSEFEKLIAAPQDKGGFGLTPQEVAKHLDDYARILADKAQPATPAASTQPAATTLQAAASGNKIAYDSLTPEWKQYVDSLKSIGFTTEDALAAKLKPIEERLASYDHQAEEQYAKTVDAAIAHGTTILDSLLKETGIASTPEMLERVGNVVGSAIDRESYDANGRIVPGSLADQYLKGNEAARREIISKQFEIFKQFGEGFSTAKSASYVASKTAAQSSQPRTLPQNSGPSSVPERTGPLTSDERARRVTEFLEANGMK